MTVANQTYPRPRPKAATEDVMGERHHDGWTDPRSEKHLSRLIKLRDHLLRFQGQGIGHATIHVDSRGSKPLGKKRPERAASWMLAITFIGSAHRRKLYLIKAALCFPMFATAFLKALADDITFTNKAVSFTNLQGQIYQHVQLVRGDLDGLIWRDKASGGRICYTNLCQRLVGPSRNR